MEKPADFVPWSSWSDSRWRPAVGRVLVLPGVVGPRSKDARDVSVLLPPSYDSSPERRYPVLYGLDGQNLLDPAASFCGSWHVDRALAEVAGDGLEAILVAVPNLGHERLDEYSPWRDRRHGGGRAEEHLDFLLGTVRPKVEASFRTRADRAGRGVFGSSMGGLFAIWAHHVRPDAFGMVAALSPSVQFAGWQLAPFVGRAPLVPGRVFLSMGTHEARGQGLLRWLPDRHVASVRRVAKHLKHKGHRPDDVRVEIVPGGHHHETVWAALMPEVLRFLLG